ncbi:MAG: ABC transporter ATP-binding protein [Acidobacteriia bacterium]|nr:ABC transporter ATP-binding protein [Terriglobia bacterium]
MTAIEFRNVSKVFAHGTGTRLLSSHLGEWLGQPPKEAFYALKNVSFSVQSGEGFGVVGHNGAGKSTLLGLATGICGPDQGEVIMNGRIAAVLELGSGFHPDLTGTENLFLNASLLGLSRKRTKELADYIVEFAGLEDFINEPMRTYSTGMTMRLAFAVAVHTDPDILILDEVIAVGDQTFQVKCLDHLRSLRQAGKTILCVSHSPDTIEQFCHRAIWLAHGQVVKEGLAREVLDAYRASL